MKFFLDTANVEEIRKAVEWGIVDGVTTNPSHIAATGRPFLEVVRESKEVGKFLSEEDIASLKPENYIGLAPQIVNNVIAFIGEKELEEGR